MLDTSLAQRAAANCSCTGPAVEGMMAAASNWFGLAGWIARCGSEKRRGSVTLATSVAPPTRIVYVRAAGAVTSRMPITRQSRIRTDDTITA